MRLRSRDRVAYALTFAALVPLMSPPSPAFGQFSPGKLSAAHESLDRPTECFKCHEPKKSATAARCLACHGELATRVTAGRGYHGRDPKRRDECNSCHGEHGGRDVQLIVWEGGRDAFDHATTGYPLDGRHAGLACEKCHDASHVRAPDVIAGKTARPGKTYLGLSTRCADCHRDVHRGQFAARIEKSDCAACHTTQGWTIESFDHAQTAYALTGKHVRVECAKCHYSVDDAGTRVAAGTQGAHAVYRPLAHDACLSCHTDPHTGRYGTTCERCHSTAAWNTLALGAFDHDRTAYPLRGLHQRVACERCHVGGDFKKKLAFARCTNCHADTHGGQLAKRADGGACDACHGVEGFAPARFGPAEHERSRFPLQGAHLAVACAACHKPTKPSAPAGSVQFKLKAQVCADCHNDAHGGQFAAGGRTDCTRCHGVATWRIAAFDHQRLSSFALEGAHATTPCAKCHRTEPVGGRRMIRYKPIATSCRSCHATVPPAHSRSSS